MSTITLCGSIGKSTNTISAQGESPLTRMLPIQTLRRQSPGSVSRSTSSTTFAECQGTTSGMSSWSSWWTTTPRWPPPPMTSSTSSSKRQLQSRDRMGSLQKLWSLQRMVPKVAEEAKSATVQRGIREIIRGTTIRKRRICGNGFIASGKGISPRTAWASNMVILQSLPTLQQKRQLKHQVRWHSPCRSRTIRWWRAQVLHLVIRSSLADPWRTPPAIDQCSSPKPNILRIRRWWRDTMGSHHFHPDMEVLGWFASWLMDWWKWSYFKKWYICQDCSISSHSLRSWTRTSKSNQWVTTVSSATIAMASWLALHLRLMGSSFWIQLWIGNRPNTPISITASCWHVRQLGMHLRTMRRTGWYGTTAWHTSVSKRCRYCWRSLILRRWPESGIARVATSASQLGCPWLRQPPAPLNQCSQCTRIYAVHWKQPWKEVDTCCSL